MKVKLRKNLHFFDSDGSNFAITGGEEKVLPIKELKSYAVKYHLFKGNLQLTEGETLLGFKHARIFFSTELNPWCYGYEFGKFFKKNIETQELFWIDKDEITNLDASIYTKLTGKEVEEPEEETEEAEIEEEVIADEVIADGDTDNEVMADGNEPKAGFAEDEIERELETSEEDVIYTKTDLMDKTKSEQIEILERLGLNSKEIKALGNEPNRVTKILELQS